MGFRKVGMVVRSIAQSYSGNLIAYTTNAGAMKTTTPLLHIADLRDAQQMEGEGGSGQATLDTGSHCCIFSHLDDVVVVGKLQICCEFTHFVFRRKKRLFVPI